MGRESDFPNLGFDPAPGDLTDLRQLVALVGRVNREGASAQTELNKIGSPDGIWVGKSANKFTECVAEIPPYLKKASGALDEAYRALSSWESSLERFQERARKLETEAEAAAKKAGAAKTALTGLPSDTEGMNDQQKEDHKEDKKKQQGAADEADAELAAIRARARTLDGEFNTAATNAARRLRDATDDAPPKPNWFESAVNGLGKMLENSFKSITDPNFWKAVGDFLADAAMVVGILAMLGVPGLGWIGLALAAGAFLAHAGALIGGAEGMTWQTLAWDAAGLFAGLRAVKGIGLVSKGKGLVAAGKSVKGFGQANVRAGRVLQSTRGFRAQLSNFPANPFKWKAGFQNLGAGARNSLQAFREMSTGFRQIAQGERYIAQGNAMISRGQMIDSRWTRGGVAIAGGSNFNSGRWLNTNFTADEDLPLLGTGKKAFNFIAPDRDWSQPLASSGSTFDNGLRGATA